VAWWLFAGFLYTPVTWAGHLDYFTNFFRSLLESLAFLPIHLSLAYSLIYFIIPYYLLKEKYTATIVLVLFSFVISAALSTVIAIAIIPEIREMFDAVNIPSSYVHTAYHYAFMAGLRGGITIGGLAAAIKLMKHWYIEGQKNLQLQKENIESQLQVLKAQVHPHFLFNTLNNIYSFTQNTSQPASKMVMGLSDILRYMLYECNQPLVPLSEELKMIDEYVDLEKIRYGNKLELHVNFPSNAQEFQIAPLLLLPFVENCFKHGISNMLEHPWLNLDIEIDNNWMSVKLLNSKPSLKRLDHKPGIGIENAKRRLELLYPGKHELTIADEEELFIVYLKLELERANTLVEIKKPSLVNLQAS
jgi:sensor histidine kinase YesM